MKPFPDVFVEDSARVTRHPATHGINTFYDLGTFMLGYVQGSRDADLERTFKGFSTWIGKLTEVGPELLHTVDTRFGGDPECICTNCLPKLLANEDKPFDAFMKLLEEFQRDAICAIEQGLISPDAEEDVEDEGRKQSIQEVWGHLLKKRDG